jgi:hypothetical protein
VPIAVPLVVGVVVVAAAVGVGVLIRKAPEKEESVAKNNATQPDRSPRNNPAPLPNPDLGATAPKANTVTPAARPSTTPPASVKEGFEIGNRAPEILGVDVDGQPFKLSDYRGKVVVLDFWGHW